MPELPVHNFKPAPTRFLNRTFALVYTVAILALLYRHALTIINSSPSLTTILLLVADLVLAFLWTTWEAFFLNPVHSLVFPENLQQVAEESEYPRLDVFICTADPFKEPPLGVVNTVLSVMAFEYPVEKLSVYVSDDGGSQLTLFALMEAAKFGRHWLPYCKKYNILDCSPEVYFGNDLRLSPETKEIQAMYENMKATIQKAVERGSILPDQIHDHRTIKAFSKWTPGFTRHHHPTVIEMLLKSNEDKDVTGDCMPNLIYVSREKSTATPHRFKAGALNALIRVSTVITNAPIFLVLDCDMYSNDPKTPLRMLCHFMHPNTKPNLALVQFPQRFHNINRYDTYAAEYVLETRMCGAGMDGLGGTNFMGTGGFFRRQALVQTPSQPQQPEPIKSSADVLALAHRVAGCSYEENTKWGSEIGFRYGSLVEDMYTSFRLRCLGWESVTCDPARAAFLGKMPITLNEFLSQSRRWNLGLLQTGLSKFSPLTFGVKFMNPLLAFCYAHFHLRAFWSIPVVVYAILPQLALMNDYQMFPKVSDPWFCLYVFLFLGAYGKNFVDFVMAGSSFGRWWNHQRMWLMLACSSYLFSISDWLVTSLGMKTLEFNVTSKVSDGEIRKRYEKGVWEFGVASPLFLPINVAAVVNLFAFLIGVKQAWMTDGRLEEMFVQLFIAGFGVVNSWPVYQGMVLRSDEGKMPMKITMKSVFVAFVLMYLGSVVFDG